MKNIISIENVSFAYNKENVLQDIILSVDEGDFVGIIGCNGSGKSTLAKIIMGILTPDSGKIIFNGIDITNAHGHDITKKFKDLYNHVLKSSPNSVGIITNNIARTQTIGV